MIIKSWGFQVFPHIIKIFILLLHLVKQLSSWLNNSIIVIVYQNYLLTLLFNFTILSYWIILRVYEFTLSWEFHRLFKRNILYFLWGFCLFYVSYRVLELVNFDIITVKILIEGFLFREASKWNIEVNYVVLLNRITWFMASGFLLVVSLIMFRVTIQIFHRRWFIHSCKLYLFWRILACRYSCFK